MKIKHFGIVALGGAIVFALWYLFYNAAPQTAATNQPNASSSGVPSSATGSTAVTPAVAPIPVVPAQAPGIPSGLTFNLGPQGDAGQQFTTQNIIGVPGSGPGVFMGGNNGAPGTGSSGSSSCGCGGCSDCNQSSACTLNKSNFDGAGACLAPTTKTQLRSIAASSGTNAPNPFSSLLSNLFLSGEGNNLSTNALQMIQFGLNESMGNGSEGYTAPAAPALQYAARPTTPGIPGYTSAWAPPFASSVQ